VDYEGTQYWSDVVTIIPHEENAIELNLDLLALDLTNDPNPVKFHGTPPEYVPEKVMVASLIDLPGLLVQSIVGQIPGETVYYYVNDHLGTPQKMVDQNGAVVWSADYEPFGEADVTVTSAVNNFRFPGQYYDEETGLHYNWHRYYASRTGRYLTPDPIGLEGHINLFWYVQNNPVSLIDPIGLCTIECCENCVQELRIRNKKTGRTRLREERNWDEILRMRALRLALAFGTATGGHGIGCKTFIIGKKYSQEEYAEYECWVEICLDFLTQPLELRECRKREGTEYWVTTSSEDITEDVCVNLELQDEVGF
jgi:RHS repeat-associated protein